MRLCYNILFLLGFCLSAPYYFWKMWRRGNWQAGFGQRFGRYDEISPSAGQERPIWLHAVSVGEVNVCAQVIRELRQRAPGRRIVVSTTTSTGMGELNKRLPPGVEKVYYPVDFLPFVRRALHRVRPAAVVLIEAEIWPNFLWQAQDRRIPLFLANARLSDKSYRGYRRFGFLFAPLFAGFAGVGAQNEADAARLREIGCRPSAVRVFGNLKFDAVHLPTKRPVDVPALLRRCGWSEGRPVLLGGSTFAGEETMLAALFQRLRAQFPGLLLVLVPRHFERAREAGSEVAATGLRVTYRSDLDATDAASPTDCLVVNTTGELVWFYEHATVVFVGKSLTPVARGGQSPIEPGALGRAMVFGPNMQNFTPIAHAFVQAGGALQVPDAPALEAAILALLADPHRRQQLGENALRVVRENQGATTRTVDMILAALPKE